nr:hypothetical protein [Tanacetum cinerariifolium]
KYDKISYDKAYKDMQQKIKRLQAQLGALKGKCTDTSCVSDTQNQVFQKLENANVELEFQVFNYAKENAHLKATYKNLFDSISVTRAQTETKIASLQNELQCNIYKNAKLRTQLFKKVSDEKANTQDSSKNTMFAKQPIAEILSKIGNLNGYNDVQNVGNQVAQNLRVQNVRNQNGLIGVHGNGNHNQIGNGNLVAVRAEGNAAGHNGNQIRCYNFRGLGHFARDCTVRPKRMDAAYLQTQLLITQKEEAGIQLQVEEYDLMAAVADLDEIKEVNANCILMANLQQAPSSGTQTDSAPVYDSDGSAEVHEYENCYNNEIFNMFTQEEQYTELLEPILEPQQVPQNDNNVISEVTDMEQGGKIVEQHSANFEETRALYESLYQNLAIEVKK